MTSSTVRPGLRRAVLCGVFGACLGTASMGSAFAQNVAVVNGTPIPTLRADVLAKELVSQGQQDTPDLRAAVREELVNREVLMEEAARQGLPNRPDIKAQIAIAQQSVVIRALMQDYLAKHTPSDAELRVQYDDAVKQMGGKEYHLHHILVDSEAEAKDLIAQIKGGASFEDLAKKDSKDTGSGAQGGDLGWSALQSYVPEFSDAAQKLQKGQITDTPVHSQFGWHIIRLDDTRDIKPPAFDDVKSQLAQHAQQAALQQWETDLRSKAKVQ